MHDHENFQNCLLEIKNLLGRHKLIEDLVHKQNLADLQRLLEQLDAEVIAHIFEDFPADDRQIIWQLIQDDRKEKILLVMSSLMRTEILSEVKHRNRNMTIRVFDLHEGRLRQIPIETKEDLATAQPIWVDLIMPEEESVAWAKEIFGVELPNPHDLTDLETSARFYVEDNGEIHLHSDFLLDLKDESRNVAVAFILNKETLFSVRCKELPVFRLQRLRARAQSGYVSEAKDLLLDLYAAEVKMSISN
ncbi:MAG: Mg2 transporter protein CorA family protein [Methylococcaceae bacterium NSP1-2]|nr:MAG: Mg2 transporter protein CorA family protein [Methylococcaceae bacterium NSP1-2]